MGGSRVAWQDERMISAAPLGPLRKTARLRRIAVLSVAAASAFLLSACVATPTTPDPSGSAHQGRTAGAGEVPTSDSTGTTGPGAESGGTGSGQVPPDATDDAAATGETVAAGPDTAGIADSVQAALQSLADGQDAVTRKQVGVAIEEGFANADAVPEVVEVSIDRTPTGLDVDAIQGAGLIGNSCVFAEVREGITSAVVLPALASGGCFVGDQR
jgi:hypothetical protein